MNNDKAIPKEFTPLSQEFVPGSWIAAESWKYEITDGYSLTLALSPSGNYFIYGAAEKENKGVIHYFHSDGKLLWKYIFKEPVTRCAISNDGEFCVFFCEDNNIYFFDQNRKIPLWKHPVSKSVRSVAISGNGDNIAYGSDDFNIYLLDKNRALKKFVWKYKCEGAVNSVAISDTGEFIAAGSDDSYVYFLDRKDVLLWKNPTGGIVHEIALSGKCDVVAGSADMNMYCYDIAGRLIWRYLTGGSLNSVSISGFWDIAAGASEDNNVYCINEKGNLVWRYNTREPMVRVRISFDGQYIVAADRKGNLYYFDNKGNLLWKHPTSGPVTDLFISRKSEFVIAAMGNMVKIFDNRKIFLQMITASQSAIVTAKGLGVNVTEAGKHQKMAADALSRNKYSQVHASLTMVAESLAIYQKALNRIAAMQNALVEAQQNGISSSACAKMLDGAKKFFEDGKYNESLDLILKCEEQLRMETKHIKDLETKSAGILTNAQSLLLDLSRFGIPVTEFEEMLNRARTEYNAKNHENAIALGEELIRQMNARLEQEGRNTEFVKTKILKLMEKGKIRPEQFVEVENGLNQLINEYSQKKDFANLANAYDMYYNYLKIHKGLPVTNSLVRNIVQSAIFAYHDANNLDKCISLALEIKDYRNAAKYLEEAGRHEEAAKVWKMVQETSKAPAPQSFLLTKAKLEAIETNLKKGKLFEAAVQLMELNREKEALAVLEKSSTMQSIVFQIRIYYNQQKYEKILSICDMITNRIKNEIKLSKQYGSISMFGHFLVGYQYLTELLGMKVEKENVDADLIFFDASYREAIARNLILPDIFSDMVCLLLYIRSLDFDLIKSLLASRKGDYWNSVNKIIFALSKGEKTMFETELRNFKQDYVRACYNLNSPVIDIVPGPDLHYSLDQLYPFNINNHIYRYLKQITDKSAIDAIKNEADTYLNQKDWQKAADTYKLLLEEDFFRWYKPSDIYFKIAICNYALGHMDKFNEAVAKTSFTMEEALAQVEIITGIPREVVQPVASTPLPVEQDETPVDIPKPRCSRCKTELPVNAIRCPNCGKKRLE
ncbi:MAG: WD40 repeat domain-containing protein [Thermoplasmata archaeon]